MDSPAKIKVIRAGRRSGKTTGISIFAVEQFLKGKRVIYATPTSDQIGKFWGEVKEALYDPVQAGVFTKNETTHIIELPRTDTRIRARTAWNADTLRGDWCDLLILDEYQLMAESAYQEVGAPMLMDRNGDAVFIYTPPSLHSKSVTKSNDPQHAPKWFKEVELKRQVELAAGLSPTHETFVFTAFDNPYVDHEGIRQASKNMSALAYRQEILAEDVEQAPQAMWTRAIIGSNRVLKAPRLARVIVAVDPPAAEDLDAAECGIIVAGLEVVKGMPVHGYVLADHSMQGSPKAWATAVIRAYNGSLADLIVAEKNQGGEMVRHTIHSVDPTVPVKLVTATRNKQTRAEPVSAQYERGFIHHVGEFPKLEDQLCLWEPGDRSPDRMDALVWAMSELMGSGAQKGAWGGR